MTALELVVARPDVLGERLAALSSGGRWLKFSWLLAIVAHTSIGAVMIREPLDRREPVRPAELTFELEPEKPPPEPEPERPPNVEPLPPEPAARSQAAKPAAAPAARAAATLQQSASPEQAVDFTDEIVTGSAATFPGGTTTSAGSSARRGTGSNAIAAPSARGDMDAAPSSGDRSRRASITGGFDWKCPFPSAADGVDREIATIRVELDAAGRTTHVSIVNDPGHGFGEAARRCASGKRWHPALDRAGNATPSSVLVAVRFVR